MTTMAKCPKCGGTGRLDPDEGCDHCPGTGFLPGTDDQAWDKPVLPPKFGSFTGNGRRTHRKSDRHDGGDVRRGDGVERDVVAIAIDANRHRIVPGGTFILDTPEHPQPIWGDGDASLWAPDEPILWCGPEGVGKTTSAQQVALHRAGIRVGPFLGYPVQVDAKKVLYVAADRPAQAQRSFRRMVGEEQRELLDERIVIWRGPLPFDLVKTPKALLVLAQDLGAGTVFIDSLKDLAPDLSAEATGSAINAAHQNLVAEGVQVFSLHHQRKAQAGGGKPRHLADVYGSRWITGGAGSVFMIWGEAGDLVVELDHLKQPDAPVGPYKLFHDHLGGRTTIPDRVDAYTLLNGATNGVTVAEVAVAVYGTTSPNRNQIEKARRGLESLVRAGKAHKSEGTRGGAGGGDHSRYHPVSTRRQGGQP
jgi:replicative DNA helicase